jgi:ADP-ribosyl-[dinitrogen reductase] hydrolase
MNVSENKDARTSDRPTVERMTDKSKGCLAGVAIGDAAGLPFEQKSSERIREEVGPDGITRYFEPRLSTLPAVQALAAGSTSDDWQLTAATATSLIDSQGLNLTDQAHAMVAAATRSTIGWGGSTLASTRKFAEFFETGGKRGHSPLMSASVMRAAVKCGNGVAMKVAPFGIYYGLRYGRTNERLIEDVLRLGRMTHGDIRASDAAIAIAAAIANLVRRDKALTTTDAAMALLREVIRPAVSCAETQHLGPRTDVDDRFSSRLRRASRMLRKGVGDLRTLAAELGTGSYALESVAFAIAAFAAHPADFDAAVMGAIQCGGDTDTIGAMVGALVGANIGWSAIPAHWRSSDQNRSVGEALLIGTKLAHAAL